MQRSITDLISRDVSFREQLVDRHGMQIRRLKLSKDRRTATAMWDCLAEGTAAQCQKDLERLRGRIQAALASMLKLRTPLRLAWQRDVLPHWAVHASSVLEEVEHEEQQQQQQQQQQGRAASGSGEEVDSAIQALRQRIRMERDGGG
jgi:ribosome-binding factor A